MVIIVCAWLSRPGKRKALGGTQSSMSASHGLSRDLTTNLNRMRAMMNGSFDIMERRFSVAGSHTAGAVLFIDNLVDETMIQEQIIKPIMGWPVGQRSSPETGLHQVRDMMISGHNLQEVQTLEEAVRGILQGNTLFIMEGHDKAYIIDTIHPPGRSSISEPITEPSVRGPKESFVEILKINLGLVRRRIKTPQLTLETFSIGDPPVNVVLVYLKGTAPDGLVQEARRRLNNTKSPPLADSKQLSHFISDHPGSIIPLIQETERPDKFAASLKEGRVGILVDNSPNALLAPATLPMLLQSVDDYYEKWIIGSIIRLSRYLALVISTLFPSVYIAMTTFHPGMLPTDLALSIAGSRAGVPFPAVIEAFLMTLFLELLQEAGIRLPRVVGQTIAIVGGLVIGQAAVQAGIIGPLMVIVISITAISSFAVSDYSLGLATRILRLPFMALAGMLGFFGIAMGGLYLLGYMCSLKSFGVGFMEPLTPYRVRDWRDTFITPSAAMHRPEFMTAAENMGQE